MATDVLGRKQELATVERLLDERHAGPLAVIIEGDAGIGKTTLWEAALDLARDRSWRVLAARPAEAEVRFSYIAVRDLLGPLIDETIHGLPGPQRLDEQFVPLVTAYAPGLLALYGVGPRTAALLLIAAGGSPRAAA
jgi:hypothetical protein